MLFASLAKNQGGMANFEIRELELGSQTLSVEKERRVIKEKFESYSFSAPAIVRWAEKSHLSWLLREVSLELINSADQILTKPPLTLTNRPNLEAFKREARRAALILSLLNYDLSALRREMVDEGIREVIYLFEEVPSSADQEEFPVLNKNIEKVGEKETLGRKGRNVRVEDLTKSYSHRENLFLLLLKRIKTEILREAIKLTVIDENGFEEVSRINRLLRITGEYQFANLICRMALLPAKQSLAKSIKKRAEDEREILFDYLSELGVFDNSCLDYPISQDITKLIESISDKEAKAWDALFLKRGLYKEKRLFDLIEEWRITDFNKMEITNEVVRNLILKHLIFTRTKILGLVIKQKIREFKINELGLYAVVNFVRDSLLEGYCQKFFVLVSEINFEPLHTYLIELQNVIKEEISWGEMMAYKEAIKEGVREIVKNPIDQKVLLDHLDLFFQMCQWVVPPTLRTNWLDRKIISILIN